MSDVVKRTFVIWVEDRPGVLNRVTSLFRRRDFNIETLTVSESNEPGVSRITVVCHADEDTAKRIEANVYKLVNVLEVDEILVDCDQDCLVMNVTPNGPACHTGATACFYRKLDGDRLTRR